jgi:hypothetical protein
LWVLSRLRFPEREPVPNPVAPVLAQLSPPPAFESLAAAVGRVQADIAESLTPIAAPGDPGAPAARVALRLRDRYAVTLLMPDASPDGDRPPIVVSDPASGLAVVQVDAAAVVAPAIWPPRRLVAPRYFLTATLAGGEVIASPVFVAALREEASVRWPDPIWVLPADVRLPAGTFVFTDSGLLAGLSVVDQGLPALVPADTVVTFAERLIARGPLSRGQLDVEVRPLTADLSAATGAPRGVVVTRVGEEGPAAGVLEVGDVVERAGDQPIESMEHWHTASARFVAGTPVPLTVRRRDESVTASVTPVAKAAPAAPEVWPLGLTLRSVPGVGAEVVRVEPRSSSDRAGVRAADVIVKAGAIDAPAPSQVRRLFADADPRPLLVAFTRGDEHHVVALRKRR